jgi:hypothetical protein
MADPKIRWRVDAGVTQANLAAQLNTVSDAGWTVFDIEYDGTNYTIIAWQKQFI